MREEYKHLRADLMRFKQDKVGTNLDETNIELQTKVTPLQLQRQKFINQMKNSKMRENETMARLQDFTSKISGSKTGWTSHQVTFHVDSERAYQVDSLNKSQPKPNF